MSEITAFVAAFHRRLGSDETHALEQQWLQRKANDLLLLAQGNEIERTKALRYIEGVREMERVGNRTEEGRRIRDKLREDVRRDLQA